MTKIINKTLDSVKELNNAIRQYKADGKRDKVNIQHQNIIIVLKPIPLTNNERQKLYNKRKKKN